MHPAEHACDGLCSCRPASVATCYCRNSKVATNPDGV
jgi:hypothetical protein